MEPDFQGMELTFFHIVDVPAQHAQYATARDSRNRIHIFLLKTHPHGPIYKRNGLKDSWNLLSDSDQRHLRTLLRLAGSRITHYTADSLN